MKTKTMKKVVAVVLSAVVAAGALPVAPIFAETAGTGANTSSSVTTKPGVDVTTKPGIDVTTKPGIGVTTNTGIVVTPANPSTKPDTTVTTKPAVAAKGTVLKDSKKNTYKVTSSKSKTVQYAGTKSKAAKVVVPATIKVNGVTYKVTSIKTGAFKGNKYVKTITVGANVKTIGKNAFANCKKLKTIKITSKKLTSASVSKGAFNGISAKTTIKVPKSKLSTYKKLFVKKGLSKKVKVKAI